MYAHNYWVDKPGKGSKMGLQHDSIYSIIKQYIVYTKCIRTRTYCNILLENVEPWHEVV